MGGRLLEEEVNREANREEVNSCTPEGGRRPVGVEEEEVNGKEMPTTKRQKTH